MVVFRPVTDVTHAHFKAAMDIYECAFPANERQPLALVTERVAKGLNQLYTGYIDNEVVFMALLWPLRHTDFILLDYMATGAAYQGRQIGSAFLQHMVTGLQARKKYFIIEAEHPEFGDNREERQKRIAFYKKNGARLLKNLRYVLPALQGNTPTEMVLMILPDYENGKIKAAVAANLVSRIYKELYNRDAGDLPSFTEGDEIELV